MVKGTNIYFNRQKWANLIYLISSPGLNLDCSSLNSYDVKQIKTILDELDINAAIKTEAGFLTKEEVETIGITEFEVFVKHFLKIKNYNKVVVTGLKEIINHQDGVKLNEALYLSLVWAWLRSKRTTSPDEITAMMSKIKMKELCFKFVDDIYGSIFRYFGVDLEYPQHDSPKCKFKHYSTYVMVAVMRRLNEGESIVLTTPAASVGCLQKGCEDEPQPKYQISVVNNRYKVGDVPATQLNEEHQSHGPSVLHFWLSGMGGQKFFHVARFSGGPKERADAYLNKVDVLGIHIMIDPN